VLQCIVSGSNSSTGAILSAISLADMAAEEPYSHEHGFYWRYTSSTYYSPLENNKYKTSQIG